MTLSSIIDLFRQVALRVVSIVFNVIMYLLDLYKEMSLTEKVIFFNSILCIISIIIPAAYFNIFNSRYYINNPVSITALFTFFVMTASLFIHDPRVFFVRITVSVFYFFLLISKVVAHTITKADPYVLFVGFYLSALTAILYIIASISAYFAKR
jgi:hypothetical protein